MAISRIINISLWVILSCLAITNLSCGGLCSPGLGDNRVPLIGGTVTISPDMDSIRIGDTLLLSSYIPTKLKEQNQIGNQTIDFSGASNVITDFNINVAIVSDSIIGGLDSFTFIPFNGTLETNPLIPNAGKTINYVEKNGEYQFSAGIIAQKKGIYALSFIDIYQARKKCLFASIQVLMNNADDHLQYLQAIHYPGSPFGDTIYPIEKTHTYCFKVY